MENKINPTWGLKNIDIELGCGRPEEWREEDGRKFYRVDRVDFGQDITWNFNKGLPFPDNCARYIYSSHCFEHVKKLKHLMNECHRVLNSKGALYIVVPTVHNKKVYTIDHLNYFNEYSFNIFEKDDHDYGFKAWSIVTCNLNERGDLHVRLEPKK